MQIKTLRVKNFRCLRDVELSLGDTTVVLGENNAGKTALLDAVRLMLSRRWGQRGTGFAEYDFYMDEATRDPKDSPGITIEAIFSEDAPDEWPEELALALDEIIQTDPKTDIDSIGLRVECQYEPTSESYDTAWAFLGRDGKPLAGKARRSANLSAFFPYAPVFSLSALRDASSEFTSRSQFWGQLLKRVRIPDVEWAEIENKLEELNGELLAADPRLGNIRDKLAEIRSIITKQSGSEIQIRALPLKAWDLIARAEVMVRGTNKEPWLPLERHGQGVQSLAVIYVFQAFVENLLQETYEAESEPILLMEEPEAHLHPQAARALGARLADLLGQKLVSTHSPYLVERVPFRDLRIVRASSEGSTIHALPTQFVERIPPNDKLVALVAKYPGTLSYDPITEELTALGSISEDRYRELLVCFTSQEERERIHPVLRALYERARTFIPDTDLERLEEWARRIRGEIFFSKAWLLCEGQTEYLLLHFFMDVQSLNLDAYGVSVIDYQNNGSPGAFAALARALEYPWLMICDGDQGGTSNITHVKDRGFTDQDIDQRVLQLDEQDMEEHLVNSGLRQQLDSVLVTLGEADSTGKTDEEFVELLQDYKPIYAARLVEAFRGGAAEILIPPCFRDLAARIRALGVVGDAQ